MSTTLRMRERLEQSRRTCLLRKVRLCEYLLGYSGTLNAVDGRPSSRNTPFNSFFPHINYHASAPTSPTRKDAINPLFPSTSDVPPCTPSLRTASNNHQRAALRPSTRQPPSMDIQELTAKTLTPTTRVATGEGDSFTTRAPRSTILSERQKTIFRRMSPRKRTYVGGVCFVKDQSIFKKQGGTGRKMSIAPWDIDAEFN